jgi:3-hydroxyisobutyrate dehydrogenase-like beta-hydroxyacid dehydrogenase
MAQEHTLGWIGAGRMGAAMATRLLSSGLNLAVYNRSREKVAPLIALGASEADRPSDLADRDVVFTNLSSSEVFLDLVCGPGGLLSRDGASPRLVVDFSTISAEASATARRALAERGAAMLDAPVSGNAKVVQAGKLSIVASGDAQAFEMARPYLTLIGPSVTYVGEGELARIVKICHNVFLGVVAQSLAEVTILAEKGGVPRHTFLEFINNSVMGSMFSRYKTPAYVNLDFKPTFTPLLLRKDLDLGLAAARDLDVPLQLAAQAREIVQTMIGLGYRDCDFAALVEVEGKAAGMQLRPENVEVDPGI